MRRRSLLGLVLTAACTASPLDAGTTATGTATSAAASPTTLATLHVAVDALAIDATYVYFTAEDGFLYRVARTGGAPEPIAAASVTGSAYTEGIALDDTSIYWTALGDGVNAGSVLTVPKTGGSPVHVADGAARPSGIAVDDSDVYWADEGPPTPDQTDNLTPGAGILRAPKAGGGATVLTSNVAAPGPLTLDPTGVVWRENEAIRRVPKGGGDVMNLAVVAIPWTTSNLVVSGASIYWAADEGVWSLQSVPLAGGDVTTLVASMDAPGGLVVDGISAFWVSSHGTNVGAVEGLASPGGDTVPLTAGDPTPGATGQTAKLFAGDASAFFWVESSESPSLNVAIRMLPR